MDKKKIEIIAVVILIIIFVFILFNSFSKVRKKTTAPRAYAPAQVMPARAVVPQVKAEGKVPKKHTWGRDPFTDLMVQTPTTSSTSLRLMGILGTDESNFKAIINDEFVSKGAKIGNLTVLRISSKSVVLTDGNRNFELKLEE